MVFIFNLVLSVMNVLALLIAKEEEMPDQAKASPEEED